MEDGDYERAYGLGQMLDLISGDDGGLASLSRFGSETDAIAAARDGAIDGYVTVDGEGVPRLHVDASLNGKLSPAAMRVALNSYLRTRMEIADVARQAPQLLAGGDLTTTFSRGVDTQELQVTKAAPDPDARYYYSLLAMSAGMGMMLAVLAVKRTQPGISALGVRSAMAGTPRWRILLATLLAAWVCELACLCTTYLFMWLVVGVGFGGEAGYAFVALAVSSLTSCALGAALGTTRIETGAVSGISCLLSLFTGLYGPTAQGLADAVELASPALSR